MIREVVGELFPPDIPSIMKWRLVMFAFACFTMLHIAWACGFLPGIKGFAMAADVHTVANKVDLILKLQVEGRLRALRQEKCLSKTDALRSTLQAEIDRLQHEHKLLDGDFYPLPSCRVYTVDGVQGQGSADD